MKKVLKVLSATMLSAVVAAGAVASVSAASDVNDNEQAILDELGTSVDLGGNETYLPDQYINQAENYFLEDDVDLTEDEADEVIEKIGAVKEYLEGTGVGSYAELSDDQIDEAVALSNEAAGVVGLRLSYDKSTRTVDVIRIGSDAEGAGNSTNGGSNARSSAGQKVASVSTDGSNNTVKTTGFDIPGVSVIAGVGVLFVTAAGVYLIRTSKKERVDA